MVQIVCICAATAPCPNGWQSAFGNEYCFDNNTVNFTTARSRCQNRNSELTSVTSLYENDYIKDNK